MDRDKFHALCMQVADEKDPRKIELLKQRMRLLLLTEIDETPFPIEKTKSN
jgi:hypothetical protein